MILEHSNPHTVFNKHKELLQSGNLRKIQHIVLTLPSGLLFFSPWHNTYKVTNSTVRIIQQPNFCHYSCKNLAKMRQTYQGVVRLYKKIMTLKWNNCASFCVAVTVIQLSVWHRELHFLNSLLYLFIVIYAVLFHNQKLSFFVYNWVEVWNSTNVVLIIKYVFVLKMVYFLSFFNI